MISNLVCCLILHQPCNYGMLNKIINPNNNFCIVCFPNIYQSSITLINIQRFHRSSTNISPHPFTLKKISHYITSIRIILYIQHHTQKLKRIVSFSSHNQHSFLLAVIINKQRKPERKKKKIPDCRNWTNNLLKLYGHSKKKKTESKTPSQLARCPLQTLTNSQWS